MLRGTQEGWSSLKSAVPNRGWMPPLDGLRGVAILMVMLFHYGLPLKESSLPQHIVKVASEFGWTGVDLFFVLSGFLITGILLDAQGADNYWSSFYSRRALRIFPIYYVSLFVLFFVLRPLMPGLGATLPPGHEMPWYFAYVPNWIDGRGRLLTAHYWSLGVEEQFYLVWPFIVCRRTTRQIFRIAVAGCVASLALRFALMGLHVIPDFILRNTFARMDALMIGAACTCLLRNPVWAARLGRYANWTWLAPPFTLALLYVCARPFSNHAPGVQGFGFTAIALSYALLLIGAVLTIGRPTPLQHFLCSGVMRTFGKYSYGAYIWHVLVQSLLVKAERLILHVSVPTLIQIPLAIAATLAFSMGSYAAIERPFLALKDRFKPRVSQQAAEQVGLAAVAGATEV